MTKLLIDTCVWLDLAKTSKGEKLLSLLEEFVEIKEASLLTTETVVDEFKRNKERVIADAGKSLSSHFDKVKEAIVKHGTDEHKDLLPHLNDLNHKIPRLGEAAIQSIRRVEDLLEKAEVIEITDFIKLRAFQRAIEKKAPFHLSKNSMGDALIIEAYNDYKIKNLSQIHKLYFITHNKSDFSLVNGNQKMPHKDLEDIFDSVKSKYFISLPEALNDINSELVEEVEFEKEWQFEPRSYTEIMEAERELERKIWYNRHQILAYKIETGKIKLIKKEEFSIKNAKDTIIDEIWEGAKRSAKAVEDLYGEENLEWDDFEWGMLNGKLSALRWVIGEDWDVLDT